MKFLDNRSSDGALVMFTLNIDRIGETDDQVLSTVTDKRRSINCHFVVF